MKKTIITLTAVVFLISCGGSSESVAADSTAVDSVKVDSIKVADSAVSATVTSTAQIPASK